MIEDHPLWDSAVRCPMHQPEPGRRPILNCGAVKDDPSISHGKTPPPRKKESEREKSRSDSFISESENYFIYLRNTCSKIGT